MDFQRTNAAASALNLARPRISRRLWVSLCVLVIATSLGCAVKTVDRGSESSSEAAAGATQDPMRSSEISLAADRKELDQLRQEMPDDVKKQNDELALVLSFLKDGDEDPNKLRDRFQAALRKKREAVDKNLRRRREDFNRSEREAREKFTAEQKAGREDFLGRRRSSADQKRYFDGQDEKRRRFHADAQERRKDFEAQIAEERRDFESLVREKTNFFNQEWRGYRERWTERKRLLDEKKRREARAAKSAAADRAKAEADAGAKNLVGSTLGSSGPAPTSLDEWDQIPSGPATPLGAGTSTGP
jgi:hypothetical protein